MSKNVTEADVLAFLKRVGCLSLGEVEERLVALAPIAEHANIVRVPAWLIEFLCGAKPDPDGNWFGDTPPGTKGAYWWRSKHLHSLVASPVQPRVEEPAKGVEFAPAKDGFPPTLLLRDTELHDDMGGGGQRIFTTAGRGYKKVKYIRADLAAPPQSPSEAVAWVPVSDRLPEISRSVLVNRVSPNGKWNNVGEDYRGSRFKGAWARTNGYQTVTHWMPLPAAPSAGAPEEKS